MNYSHLGSCEILNIFQTEIGGQNVFIESVHWKTENLLLLILYLKPSVGEYSYEHTLVKR